MSLAVAADAALAELSAATWASYRQSVPLAADAALPVLSGDEMSAVREAMAASMSPATARAYAADWEDFARWCAATGRSPLPAHGLLLAAYLADRAAVTTPAGGFAYTPATLTHRVAGVNKIHRAAGLPAPGEHPAVAATLSGIRRVRQARPNRRAPLLLDDLRAICVPLVHDGTGPKAPWPVEVAARRDLALLLVGFIGAYRRSELAGTAFADVRFDRDDGLHVTLPRSKTDQEGHGEVKVIPPATVDYRMCPVCAYWRWTELVCTSDRDGREGVIRVLDQAEPMRGHVCRQPLPVPADPTRPVFRTVHRLGHIGAGALSGAAVHAVVRRRAAAAGFDPQLVAQLGGHSLRAGFVTQSKRNGASNEQIMKQTFHKSDSMIHLYTREYAPAVGNAATSMGL